jgi:hypothetical protein
VSNKKFEPIQFELEGKKYNVIVPFVNIPTIGILSAKDVATDAEAQKYLVDEKCNGIIAPVA